MLYMTKDPLFEPKFYFYLKFGNRCVRAFYNYNQLWIAPSKLALNYHEQKVKIQIKIRINLDCFSDWLLY